MQTTLPVKKGQEIEGVIQKMAYKGQSILFLEGNFPIFLPRGIVGQTVRARIGKVRKKYAEGKILEVLLRSSFERAPLCPHTERCGGCTFQTLNYEKQQEVKDQFLREALTHIGGLRIDQGIIEPLVALPREMGYRNKLEFSFGVATFYTEEEYAKRREEGSMDDGLFLGMHYPGMFDRILPITQCILGTPMVDTIRQMVYDFARASGHSAYNSRTHEGVWRHLMIRLGEHTKEVLVTIVGQELPEAQTALLPLYQEMEKVCQKEGYTLVGGLYANNTSWSDVSYTREVHVVVGRPYLYEKLFNYTFTVSPYSFFQVNTKMTEELYGYIGELVGKDNELLVDLYAGTGTIGITLADYAKRIVSIEREPSAVEDAKENAKRNGVTHLTAWEGTAEGRVKELLSERTAISAVILDPPREGVKEEVISFIAETQPERVVYVSCNPTTLARDLGLLQGVGYTPKRVRGFDLFPHTYHVETVVLLEKTTLL